MVARPLGSTKKLAGLMTMSTYFATRETIVVSDVNKAIPIHVFHGTQDMLVQETLGQQAIEALGSMGYDSEFKRYPMGHEVCLEEIKDISAWLQSVLM